MASCISMIITVFIDYCTLIITPLQTVNLTGREYAPLLISSSPASSVYVLLARIVLIHKSYKKNLASQIERFPMQPENLSWCVLFSCHYWFI
jgi:hypothetical protein